MASLIRKIIFLTAIVSLNACITIPQLQAQVKHLGYESVKRIEPTMMGFNNQFAYKNDPWNNEQNVQSIIQSRAGMIRYPGGTVTNYWDHLNDRLFKTTKVIDPNTNNPVEAIQEKNTMWWVANYKSKPNSVQNLKLLYENMKKQGYHFDILFVLNVSTPGVDYYRLKWGREVDQTPLSDDWWKMADDRYERGVDMLTRAQKLGIPVKYVEFGNEIFFGQNKAGTAKNGGSIVEPYNAGAENTDLIGAFPDPGDSYGKLCNEWSKRLKQSFPGVTTCALAADPNGKTASRRNRWNQVALKDLNPELVDAVSLHIYQVPKDGDVVSSEENLVKSMVSWRDQFDLMVKDYELYIPEGFDLWFTEWNPRESERTWGHGLLCMYVLDQFLQDFPLTISNYHMFYQHIKKKSGINATGRAFSVLSMASNGMTQAERMKFSGLPKNSHETLELIFGYRFRNENGDEQLFLVNLSSEPQEIELDKNITANQFMVSFAELKNSKKDPRVNKVSLKENGSLTLPPFSVLSSY